MIIFFNQSENAYAFIKAGPLEIQPETATCPCHICLLFNTANFAIVEDGA